MYNSLLSTVFLWLNTYNMLCSGKKSHIFPVFWFWGSKNVQKSSKMAKNSTFFKMYLLFQNSTNLFQILHKALLSHSTQKLLVVFENIELKKRCTIFCMCAAKKHEKCSKLVLKLKYYIFGKKYFLFPSNFCLGAHF